MPEYSIAELANLADVTTRTVRFYIVQGLLPAPTPEGPKTRYTDEHLERLLAIKKLQAAHLPLAEIRARLHGMPAETVAELALQSPPPPSESAVDYIRGVLGNRGAPAPSQPAMSVPPPVFPSAGPLATGPPPTSHTEPDRSQWDRVQINPDIELHVRRPLTRGDNKRVYRLIEYARQLFEEDQ